MIAMGALFYFSGIFEKTDLSGKEAVDETASSEVAVSEVAAAESSKPDSALQYPQTPEPLSRFRENPHWQAFLSSEPKRVHFLDEAPEWSAIAPGVMLDLFQEQPTIELLSFHQGLDFCQNVRGKSESVSAKMWQKWFAHLGIDDMDEFGRRDLIESEKAAYEEILSSLPESTPYQVVTDQVYKLGEYDFDQSAFHLDHSHLFFPDEVHRSRLWPPSGPIASGNLFVSETDARELRAAGVEMVCVREEITMEWNTGWWLEGKKIDRSLVDLHAERFVSPGVWELRGEILQRKGQPSKNATDDFRESFLTALEEYHNLYAENVTPFYSVFSVVEGIQKGDANDFAREVVRMHDMRDAYAVGLNRFQAEKILRKQLELLNASDEFEDLVLNYLAAAGTGFHFVGAETPQASLAAAPEFLKVHQSVYAKHKEILTMLGEAGAPGEGG